MYFWNIKQLKQELQAERISEHAAFSYFFAVLVLDTIMISSWGLLPSGGETSQWEYLEAAASFFIVVIGALVLYHRNGAANGRSFFIRYFALLWVMGIRIAVFCIVPVFIVLTVVMFDVIWSIDALPGDAEADISFWPLSLAVLCIYLLYYWRLAVHFGDVALQTKELPKR